MLQNCPEMVVLGALTYVAYDDKPLGRTEFHLAHCPNQRQTGRDDYPLFGNWFQQELHARWNMKCCYYVHR